MPGCDLCRPLIFRRADGSRCEACGGPIGSVCYPLEVVGDVPADTRAALLDAQPGGGVCRCLNPDSPLVCEDCPETRRVVALCACPARDADSCALLRFPMTPREERDPCDCPCHDDTDADEWWWERSDSTTLHHLLDVLAELDDDALALYGLRADATAPLDVALFAWRRAGCPR